MRRLLAIVAVVLMAAGLVWCLWLALGSGSHTRQRARRSTDPLAPAVGAYNHGKYREAEAVARRIIEANAKSKDPAKRRKAVEGRYVLAFSSARRKDMTQARDRFAVLRAEAAKLPDKGARDPCRGWFDRPLRKTEPISTRSARPLSATRKPPKQSI